MSLFLCSFYFVLYHDDDDVLSYGTAYVTRLERIWICAKQKYHFNRLIYRKVVS